MLIKTVSLLLAVSLISSDFAFAGDLETGLDEYTKGNFSSSLKLLKPLAERGQLDAEIILGSIYEKGLGVKQDIKAAIKWYEKAAEKLNPQALFQLGDIYETGNGVDRDSDLALQYFDLAANSGELKAKDRFNSLIEELKISAESSDPKAQYRLGVSYSSRNHTLPQDLELSVKWLTASAKQGSICAMDLLGNMYELGNVPKIEEGWGAASAKWYLPAAKLGDPLAQFKIGFLYEHGEGFDKNITESIKWYMLSANQGNADAQFALAKLYDEGNGVPKDHLKAYTWYFLSSTGSQSYGAAAMRELDKIMPFDKISLAKQLAKEKLNKEIVLRKTDCYKNFH